MTEVKIDWHEVNNIPISHEFIQSLGELFGESIFLINRHSKHKQLTKWNREKCEYDYKIEEIDAITLLEVIKCANGYTALIGGNFASEYKNDTITKICKLKID